MKKVLTLLATLAIATGAHAQTEFATVTKVTANYENVQVPQHRTECRTVEVPIYGSVQGQASTSDTIVGAVIGGAIGNQVGGGSGRDAATVLGAIVGADIANKRKTREQIVGYRQERVCENITFYETLEQVRNYSISYEWNGIPGRTITYNKYQVGDRIPVSVSIRAQ